MTALSIAEYARLRGVPVSTVVDAARSGQITRRRDGRLNAEEVDAGWYADHLARAAQVKATEASRVKRRDAAAVAVASAISALRRQIAETQRTTAARTATEAARARQLQRLHAALQSFPALYGPEVDLWPDVRLASTSTLRRRLGGHASSFHRP